MGRQVFARVRRVVYALGALAALVVAVGASWRPF